MKHDVYRGWLKTTTCRQFVNSFYSIKNDKVTYYKDIRINEITFDDDNKN